MKRYLTFYGDEYYPAGGMEDYAGDFDTLDDAKKHLDANHLKEKAHDVDWKHTWCHVWDTSDMTECFSKGNHF